MYIVLVCVHSSYSLTLIDSLDMLVIMGNNSEFQRVAQLVLDHTDFDLDINVSVFETNIRSKFQSLFFIVFFLSYFSFIYCCTLHLFPLKSTSKVGSQSKETQLLGNIPLSALLFEMRLCFLLLLIKREMSFGNAFVQRTLLPSISQYLDIPT